MDQLLVKWTRLLAIFTGLLFAVTVIIALFSYWQLRDSKEAFVTGQRAFVYAGPITFLPALAAEDKATKIAVFFVPMVNSGNTPTKEFTFTIRCAPSAEAMPEPWVLLYRGEVEHTPDVTGPKASGTARCTFTADQLLQMRDQKLHGYIMGDITYRDRVEGSILHRTQFCREITDINIDDNMTQLTALTTISRGKHNCADDDCPK